MAFAEKSTPEAPTALSSPATEQDPPHIKPTRRRQFALTNPRARRESGLPQKPGTRRQFVSMSSSVAGELPLEPPAEVRHQFIRPDTLAPLCDTPMPHLHPVLQEVETQETRALPLLSPARRSQFARADQSLLAPVGLLHRARSRGVSPETDELAGVDAQAGREVILYSQENFFVCAVHQPGQKVEPLRKPTGQTERLPALLPRQKERMASSVTRFMPRIELRTNGRTRTLPMPFWLETLALLTILTLSIVLHALQLFNYPAYTLDEGTYMQNAWAVTLGRLSPYAYGYGHPPLGWIQIALWVKLTGLFRFGDALNSGRILMVLYAVGSALLVYLIARRLSGSTGVAALAMLFFACSPLSVIFQREVLLDNLATFWLLLALYLLVASQSRLLAILGAALALGTAVLCKEVIAICLPALVYAAWLYSTPFQRKFALVTFVYISVAVISTYILMAMLRGELFPYAWHLPWDTHPHLSILDTLIHQVGRSQGEGSLSASWQVWWQDDALLMVVSLLAPIFNLVYGWRNRTHLLLALLSLSYWILLVRGGVVFTFYLIPLLPLTALNAALVLHVVGGWLVRPTRLRVARLVLVLLAVLILLPYDISGTVEQVRGNPVAPQQAALSWIHKNVPHKAYIVISAYLYLDLRLPGGEGVGSGATFPNAEVYWNVATDPAIYTTILHNDWKHIDYLVVDSPMLYDITNSGDEFALLQQALDHAEIVASFSPPGQPQRPMLWIYQVQHDGTLPLVQAPSPTSGGSQG